MKGKVATFARLLVLQATWNFERMQGVGMGYAALPLLEEMKQRDPARYPDAVARSTEFFNCHPYLAGIAVGSTVRAEYDGVDGSQILRLRTALCGPLGALGDRLFWTGVVPSVMAATCLALTQGGGVTAVVMLVILYNALRLATGAWALEAGLGAGMQVSRALADSWLTRSATRINPVAGFLVGLTLPKVLLWLMSSSGTGLVVLAIGVGALGTLLSFLFPSRATSFRYGLVTLIVALLIAGRMV